MHSCLLTCIITCWIYIDSTKQTYTYDMGCLLTCFIFTYIYYRLVEDSTLHYSTLQYCTSHESISTPLHSTSHYNRLRYITIHTFHAYTHAHIALHKGTLQYVAKDYHVKSSEWLGLHQLSWTGSPFINSSESICPSPDSSNLLKKSFLGGTVS